MNFTGFPVTIFADSSAPPRVSESNLVRISPSSSNCSLNAFALFTASCPAIASITRKIWCGLICPFTSRSSPINSSSMCSRPAVSRMTMSRPLLFASLIAARQTDTAAPFATCPCGAALLMSV
jgi:hypothetical protein